MSLADAVIDHFAALTSGQVHDPLGEILFTIVDHVAIAMLFGQSDLFGRTGGADGAGSKGLEPLAPI